ncbi:DUF4238 domain-containing protein [Streptococcus mutans]|nr:DUF4238 domain-containing protein [Streptococcus mutans]MCB4997589.1 DUF4238 domain-containing protein [Streptococcus mutans]MCB5003938.1 DUF4238 domain-containing protein [Streptococcus mutans]MCB5037903.1 DUF4238 domain-containing protein [Streptococcus mutans]MCB5064029.1 DUF4238 domain-containing protein [Streptococcus mutans]
MVEDNTRQHIIPQVYLKWFGQKNKKGNYYVKVTLKSNDKTFTKSIREVGYKRNYYNVSQRKDDKHWEKYFSQNIEPFYGDPLRNIITKIMLTSDNYKAEVLTKEDKKILSKLIVFQLLRTPIFLNRQLNKADYISNESKKELLLKFGQQLNNRSKKELLNVKMSQDEAKDIALETISNDQLLEIVSDVLIGKIWCIYLNKASTSFVTSDNPVIMYNCVSKKIGYDGIGRNDTFIYFPLTSYILIQLIPDISLTQVYKSVDGILQYITDIKFINSVNNFQKRNSDEIYQLPKWDE